MSDLIDPDGGPDEPDPDFEPYDDPAADPPASDADWADDDAEHSVTEDVLCVDGVSRPYTMVDGVVVIDFRGAKVEGSMQVVDGVEKWRPNARHPGAHRIFYPDPS